MFVKPAGNAYLVREGGMRLGGLCQKGSARRTVGKAGPLSREHESHTNQRMNPPGLCVLCLQEEVIKERMRLGTAMFT